MSISDRLFSKKVQPADSKSPHRSFLRRIDLRLPWLKLIAVIIIGIIILADLCDLTISRTGDLGARAIVAPMVKHARVTKRDLEGKMLIALTFDDGPSSATTPSLLDILYDEEVPATFFILGSMARNNPDLVKRIEKEGHEVASHTMYHQNLIRISTAAVESDIGEANATFMEILGHSPSLTRTPYGNTNDIVRSRIGTPIILWSVDTLDWQNKDPAAILENTLNQVHDGAIILMHDIHPTSVEAVPSLINALRNAGYEFVTVSELAKIRGVALSAGATYYNFRP